MTFPSQLPADILYKFLISAMHDIGLPSPPTLTTIIMSVKRPNYELHYANFQGHITSSLLSQNIFLGTLVSNTPNFDLPLKKRPVLYPKETS